MRVEPREESTSRPAWTRGFVILRRSSTMANEAPPNQEPPAEEPAGIEDDALFEAPERGSADELLDAGAHDELDAMRHSTAHVMAEAVLDLFPGTQLGIGPAIKDGFYYDFKLDRPLTPADLAADRGADGGLRRGGPSVRPEGAAAGGGEGLLRGAQPAVQGRDPRRPRREGEGDEQPDAADERLRARPIRRPVQGAPRREHREDRALQAARRLRRVLARRPAAARPPADLRHGLGRRRRTWTPTSGGGRRRRSATTAGSASSSTSTASTTCRPAPRSGTRRASGSGGPSRARCASSRPATATTRSRRRSS